MRCTNSGPFGYLRRGRDWRTSTWALEAYQEIMVRGGGLMDVLPHCGVLLAFTAAFFAVALWRFRFE